MYQEPKRIVHFLNSFKVGGIESVVIELSNQLTAQGNEVYLIVLSKEPIIKPFFITKEVKVIYMNLNVYSIPGILKSWIFGSLKISRVIKRINPDIIHLHSYFQVFAFLVLTIKRSGVQTKIFRTVHTSGLFYNSKNYIDRFRRKIELITIKNSHINLIAISKTILVNNEKYFGDHAVSNTLIYNGINLKKYLETFDIKIFRNQHGFRETDILIIYVSRFVEGKNHLFLLDIIRRNHQLFTSCKFLFLGDGPLLKTCQEFVLMHNIKNFVSFEGSVGNVNEYLLSCDIGVFPSDFEGFPISLIEMMSSKLPILASDIDIFQEILVNNETGLIFKLGDKEDFTTKLNHLINNNLIRNEIGNKAYLESKKFDIRKIANDLMIQYSNSKIYDNQSL